MTSDNKPTDIYANDQNRISKFTINLSRDLQHRIKLAASQNGVSISEYLERILDETVPDPAKMRQERHPATRKMLEELMQVREQVMRDSKGEIFEDSTELIRQMREEHSRELEQL